MRNRLFLLFTLALLAGVAACTFKPDPKLTEGLAPGTYAYVHTNMGDFVIKFFTEKAPKTCANFIGLAEGTKPFVDPNTKKEAKRPFYDGLIFFRVESDNLIQGGDPLGTSQGDPGYKFADEFNPDLRYDRKGIVGMANGGPNDNGCQFFITLRPLPELDNKHSVFGEVVRGIDVVQEISRLPQRRQRPIRDAVMKKVLILRVK